MKKIFLLIPLFISLIAFAQSKPTRPAGGDETSIRKILGDQAKAWSRGDAEGFMQGYWKSDSLMFIGKNGIDRGWETTLNNYKKKYPDATSMGKLAFDIILVKRLSSEYYYVVGKWMLTRSIGDLSGYYNLLFQKIRGRWVIIADHSS